jgi:hypothetical protein
MNAPFVGPLVGRTRAAAKLQSPSNQIRRMLHPPRAAPETLTGVRQCKPSPLGWQRPRSGRGGRRFKSCHSDQLHWSGLDFPQPSATAVVSDAPQVHKSVHRRELRMVKLQQDSKGNYRARKRLPDDVRAEYGRLYGAHHEAKFFAPKSTKTNEAKRQFGEWLGCWSIANDLGSRLPKLE